MAPHPALSTFCAFVLSLSGSLSTRHKDEISNYKYWKGAQETLVKEWRRKQVKGQKLIKKKKGQVIQHVVIIGNQSLVTQGALGASVEPILESQPT